MRDDDAPERPLSIAPDAPDEVARVFHEAYDAYLDPLCRYVYAYVKSWETARDLVSDVFATLWLRLTAGESVQHTQAYLYRTARNRAIDYLRRQDVRGRHAREQGVSELHLSGPVQPADVEERLEERDVVAALQRAVDQLPPQQRQVVLLRWRGEATNVEAAAKLGIAPNTASEHFRRAVEHLRAILPDMLRDLL